jgi:hypothetical protein
MDTSTRAERMQIALQLSQAMKRRTLADDPQAEGPRGDCGRDIDDPRGCGMKDESECKIHCDPAADDPALLSISGTRRQARAQLKAERRQGLRLTAR